MDLRGTFLSWWGQQNTSYFQEIGQFLNDLDGYVDKTEEILTVYAYKTHLSEAQVTAFIIYHLFIVFQMKLWWWSIEKDGEGIIIRRSKEWSTIHNENKKEIRGSKVIFVRKATGNRSIGDLIHWLCRECELSDSYHFLFSNCKTFAKRVFDYVSVNKKLCWYDGAFS